MLGNCQTCHDGTGARLVDSGRTSPRAPRAGLAMTTVDFATGVNHPGGPQATDDSARLLPQAPTAPRSANAVVAAHDWTVKDVRNLPEFAVTLSISTPANGTHFVPGESPKISIQIADLENGGAIIDHNTVRPTPPPRVAFCRRPCRCLQRWPTLPGLLEPLRPRAARRPEPGPHDRARVAHHEHRRGSLQLSAAGAVLDVKFDGGRDLQHAAKDGESGPPGKVSRCRCPPGSAFCEHSPLRLPQRS